MNQFNTRLGRRISALALGMAMLAGGALSASAQSVIHWLHIEANPEYLAVWEELAAEYEAANPGVNIEFQFLENEAFKARLPTLLQSNQPPSLFYTWGGGVLLEQSRTGAIRPITEAIHGNGGEWASTLVPASVQAMTLNDDVWAVPFQHGVLSFFYNRELFEEAGVDGEAIETWDDFLAAVSSLKDAGITPIAGGGGEKWPLHFYWSYLAMREAGYDGFQAAKAGEGEGFAGEAFVRASQHMADLGALEPFQNGYLNANWGEAQALFADGRAAILLGFEGNGSVASQARNASDGVGQPQENIGRIPFPVIEGAPGLVTDVIGGINGWVVTTAAPPETEDFLKFLTNEENQRRQALVRPTIPTAIGAEDAVSDPMVQRAAEQLGGATWHQNFLDQDLGPNVGRIVNDMSVDLAAGFVTPEEAVSQIQDAYALENM